MKLDVAETHLKDTVSRSLPLDFAAVARAAQAANDLANAKRARECPQLVRQTVCVPQRATLRRCHPDTLPP